jgi:acyl-CoA thioester hydrolase
MSLRIIDDDSSKLTEIFEYQHVVGPDEIDELGHANNVVYVAWLQDAALAHCAALGWTAQRYQKLGLGWVARSHKIEYLKPAFAGDLVVVQTWVATMQKVTSIRRYQIIREKKGTGPICRNWDGDRSDLPAPTEGRSRPEGCFAQIGPVPLASHKLDLSPFSTEILAKAETNWAFIDYATGKPTRIPTEISGAFQLLDRKRERH